MLNILDGVYCSKVKQEYIRENIKILYDECKIVPKLAIILIGDNPSSVSYVKGKEKLAEKLGIQTETIQYSVDEVTNFIIIEKIKELNNRIDIHGILVQLPLPIFLNEDLILNTILPEKDVDGVTYNNIGKLVSDKTISDDYSYFIPCTPKGILYLLDFYHIETENKKITVIGRSNIVGKPIANLLGKNHKNANGCVTLIHSKITDYSHEIDDSDIIISAVGKPNFLKINKLVKDITIIDVGITRIQSNTTKSGFRLVGDFDSESASKSYSNSIFNINFTPVPGGVGPLTVTMLMDNLVQSAFLVSSKMDIIKKQLKGI